MSQCSLLCTALLWEHFEAVAEFRTPRAGVEQNDPNHAGILHRGGTTSRRCHLEVLPSAGCAEAQEAVHPWRSAWGCPAGQDGPESQLQKLWLSWHGLTIPLGRVGIGIPTG